MLNINIPGNDELQLTHLVLDYNGTLAEDGRMLAGVHERLTALSEHLTLHLITADTFGTARAALTGVDCRMVVLPADRPQDEAKQAYVAGLGQRATVCVGNGHNDSLMLQAAALGIAVIQAEGAAIAAVLAADVVTVSILDALDLLLHPLRLVATLRV
jgi:soluble P-type ATPase